MLRERMSKTDTVLLVCCVTDDEPGIEAVEYCHKIRHYFTGCTEKDASYLVE